MDNINEQMTSDTMDAELESAWGDESDGWEESAEAEVNQPTQQQEGTPAPETNGDQTAANQQQEALENQQAPTMIPYKYMGEQKQMAASEAAPYIQKGMHYDTVVAERDQLRQFRDQNQAAVDFLTRHAQSQGMSVEQYLQQVQKQELMRRGMSEPEATRELDYQQRKAALDAQQKQIDARVLQENSAQAQAKAKQDAFKQEITSFMKAYPGVKATDVPKEVWAQMQQGVPLVSAYAMHENARLQAELAAERQNKANAQRTPGSMSGNRGQEMDEIDRYWAEDDD